MQPSFAWCVFVAFGNDRKMASSVHCFGNIVSKGGVETVEVEHHMQLEFNCVLILKAKLLS